MSRFANIAKGTRATRDVDLPMPGTDAPIKVTVRVLNALETGSVEASAKAYALAETAKARPDADRSKLPEPKEGDRLYDLGFMGATLLIACVDPDDHVAPFFASLDEVLTGLDVDRLALLFEEQQMWQDLCAPRPKRIGHDAFMSLVVNEAAIEEDAADGPFSRLPLSTQRISFRTLARMHVSSLLLKSASSSAASAGTAS